MAAFRDSDLDPAAPRAKYAFVATGLLRTWERALPSLERAVLAPNAPIDAFLRFSVESRDDVGAVERTLARLARRSLTVATFNRDTMNAMSVELGVPCTRHRAACVGDEYVHRHSAESKGILNNYRSRLLAWTELEAFSRLRNATYDAVVVTRPDIAWPLEPLSLAAVAAHAPRLLIPASIDFPLNDQLALGPQETLADYAAAYDTCQRWPPRRGPGVEPLCLTDHPCGKHQRGLEAAIAPHLDPKAASALRRFWFEYYILRDRHLKAYATDNATWTKSHNPIACWGMLSWNLPQASPHVLVNVNTTCSCNPPLLAHYDKGRVKLPLAKLKAHCNYDGTSRCSGPRACSG